MDFDNPTSILIGSIIFAVIATAIVPATGGAFLLLGCRAIKAREVRLFTCWKAYLVSYLVASALTIPLAFALPREFGAPTGIAWLVIFSIALSIHLIIVPQILKLPLRRALAAQGIGYGLNGMLIAAIVIPIAMLFVGAARNRFVRSENLHRIAMAMLDFDEGHSYPPLRFTAPRVSRS